MNYTMQQKAARERREALLVSVIGWTGLVIGAVLATLSVYTATVLILGYPH
mgnify:FL=1